MKPTPPATARTTGRAAGVLAVIGVALLAAGILGTHHDHPLQDPSVAAARASTTPGAGTSHTTSEGTAATSPTSPPPAAAGGPIAGTHPGVGHPIPAGASGDASPRDPRLASPTALQAAAAFMTAYRRPTPQSQQQWWAGIRPYLSSSGAQAYHDLDPATIPFTAVTGPPGPVADESTQAGQVLVAVPTDAGIYLVQLAVDPPHQVELLIRALD